MATTKGCQIAGCDSRPMVRRPNLCRQHFHDWDSFCAGYQTATGHNWWMPGADAGQDDLDGIMAAYLRYQAALHSH